MDKPTSLDHPISPLLANRWSPCAFAAREVATTDLLALLEAARWAPSCYNEQPWRYLVARRATPAAFEAMLACLVEGNRGWAQYAPVLLLGLAVTTFERNGKHNSSAAHDLGQASAHLSVEATARGLVVHQMAGIEHARIREVYRLPAAVEPMTALAVGYLGSGENLPEDTRQRDRMPRVRKPQEGFVFEGEWNRPARFS